MTKSQGTGKTYYTHPLLCRRQHQRTKGAGLHQVHHKSKNNAGPNTFAALGYDTIYMIKRAIRKAGKGTPPVRDVRNAVASMTFDGVTGQFTMDKSARRPSRDRAGNEGMASRCTTPPCSQSEFHEFPPHNHDVLAWLPAYEQEATGFAGPLPFRVFTGSGCIKGRPPICGYRQARAYRAIQS